MKNSKGVSNDKNMVQGPEDLELRGRVETFQTTALFRSVRTEKNPGDLKRLAVTQTPLEYHQLTVV